MDKDAPIKAVPNPPPYPDRDINTTFWLSLGLGLIGLDHFYLRSPMTGTLKLLTFGGLGFWWLWDVLQLLFERQSVALYGLTAPFELASGIGQGQISTAPTHIKQRTDYFNWFLSAFLDIFGITALIEGRPAAFLRRLIDGVLLVTFASSATIFGILMAFIFAFFTIVPSFFTIKAIFNPAELAVKGVHIPQNLVKLLNFFESWTDIIGKNATAVVRHDFGLAAVDPTSAPREFGYANEEEIAAEQEAAAAAGKTNKKELTSWPISLLLGNVFGGLALSIVNLFSFIPTVKMGLLAADSYFAAVRLSRGETPDIPDVAGFLPPGVGNLASKATAITEKVSKLGGLAEKAAHLGDLAETITEAPQQLLGQAVSKQQEMLEKGKQGLLEKVTAALPTSSQKGGALPLQETMSTESLVLGTTVIALIAGGAIKLAVDSLVGN